jgi:hypothetical protein
MINHKSVVTLADKRELRPKEGFRAEIRLASRSPSDESAQNMMDCGALFRSESPMAGKRKHTGKPP